MASINKLEFYLLPQPHTTIFTARVNGAPADPYVSIDYDAGVTGSFGNPIPGQSVWFGSTAGGAERGVRRLRSFGAGTIGIDESDDVGPLIQDDDHITIKWDFRLWPKYPRFVQNGGNVTIYEDYDIAYTNQTDEWRPVAVAGPPGVAFLSGGQAQISFVGDRSFAGAPGASISSYLWTAWDSAEGTSASQGTEGSPVVFTWTAPGWHLVSLQVTDDNGNSHTNYTWAIVVDPANATDVAFLDYDTHSDYVDFNQGGGETSFTVRSGGDTDDFPEEGMVVHAARGTITTATGSWPFRTNVLFVGWILKDTVRQDPETGDISFRAATIDAIMRNLSMFPVSLTSKTTPVSWTQAASLTVDRAASFLYHYRSTLALMGWIRPSNYTGLIQSQTFGPGNLYSQVQNELVASILGQVVCTHQSVVYHVIDYNVQNASERATVTTRKLLHKGIWVDDVGIEERHDYAWPVNQVKMSGIYYPGGDVEDICPSFTEAPGDAPKSYGREANVDRLIVLSQADLNVRSGHMLAKMTQRYPVYRMQFLNDGSFTTAPQELFPAVIEAGDNLRGLSFTGNLIPRRISRSYNHDGGYFMSSVEFEPETSGTAGVTVDMPCGPPDQELPGGVNPDPPSGIPGLTALVIGTSVNSFYYAPGVAQTWARRVNGLLDPSQLAFQDVVPDDWSNFKLGYNPERRILWGAGAGFLVRTEDTGKAWKDRSSYLEPTPAWPGETSPDLDDITPFELRTDIFNENRLFVLARWQYTGSWHGAVALTDDGFSYTWYNITGSTQIKPLGLSVDRGNGATLWITTWESDPTGMYLRQYSTVDMSLSAQYWMGTATEGQIDAQSRFAHPFNRLGAAGEVFVYGNMLEPQGFTGTVQVLKNDNGGVTGSYEVIEDTWGSDVCGTFGSDADENYYAVRQGP